MPVEATVQADPPAITLEVHKKERSYQVFRKGPHDLEWSAQVGTIPIGDGTWTDTDVVAGVEYEYRLFGGEVDADRASLTAFLYGYIRSGIEVDMTDWRGRVIVVVAQNILDELPDAFEQYKKDLVGDGWTVHTVVAPTREDTSGEGFHHVALRDEIISIYGSYPGEVKHVALVGEVPIVRTGNRYFGPDGHGDVAAFGTDAYFADVDDDWTDTSQNSRTEERYRNLPNDGKYDLVRVPDDDLEFVELGFGRFDFGQFRNDNISKMETYLNKLHRYKHAAPSLKPGRRSIIRGGFDNVRETGWNSLSALVGLENIDYYKGGAGEARGRGNEANLDALLSSEFGPSLFYFKGGGGPNLGDAGRSVFMTGMQSFWGFWADRNAMASAIGSDGWTLSVTWSIWGLRYFYHRMGLGDVTGDMMKTSINNRGWQGDDGLYRVGSDYWVNGNHTGALFMNHIGDPMLRLYMFPPVSNLGVVADGEDVDIAWKASPDPEVIGYHVYRSTSMDEPFIRLTNTPIELTEYTDSGIVSTGGSMIYQVRAVKLEQTGSGTFFNGSQGIFREIDFDNTPDPLTLPEIVLPKAFAYTNYRHALEAVGGILPYEWKVVSGLPSQGFSLSSSGEFVGNAYNAGSYDIVFEVTDAAGSSQTRTARLEVSDQIMQAILPDADTDFSGNSNKNFGTKTTIQTVSNKPGLLRFEIDRPGALTTISSAKLSFVPNVNTDVEMDDSLRVGYVDDDSWVENIVTFDTSPSESLSVTPVLADAEVTPGERFEIDVTSIVAADLAQDSSGVVTLTLRPTAEKLEIASSESTDAMLRPQLAIEYPAGPKILIESPADQRMHVADQRMHVAPGVDAYLQASLSHPSLDPASISVSWSMIDGPSGRHAIFSEATALATAVSFDAEGTYQVRVDADDGALTDSQLVTIHVAAREVSVFPDPEAAHFPLDEGSGDTVVDRISGSS